MSDAVDAVALLELARTAATLAGERILAARLADSGTTGLRSGSETKSSGTDLVTEVDRACESLIVAHLTSARPDDGVVGEEGSARAGTSGIEWVIDPIDGTTNFVYGYPAFCVSIAAVDADGALAGVVHDPLRAETFAAVRGGGSTCNGIPFSAPPVAPPLSEALLATGFAYRSGLRAAQGAVVARVVPVARDIRRSGSAALDLCSVACGRVDGYFEAGLARWDREAGVLIATEAGRVVREFAGPEPDASTLVVTAPALLDDLLALLTSAE